MLISISKFADSGWVLVCEIICDDHNFNEQHHQILDRLTLSFMQSDFLTNNLKSNYERRRIRF